MRNTSSKTIRVFIFPLFFLGAPLFGNSNEWVQPYLDCLCFTGKAQACLNDMKAREQLPAELVFPAATSALDKTSEKEISEMRTALVILENQSALGEAEKTVCLAAKREDLKASVHFALAERSRAFTEMHWKPESYAVISGLARLAKKIYAQAYEECLNPTASGVLPRYENQLPDPSQCVNRVGAGE